VINGTEQVRLECHWHGGNQTSHRLIRPVARVKALSTYSTLVTRAAELHQAGRNCAEVAEILNEEAWRPPKRRDTFNAPMVHRLLIGAGILEPRHRSSRVIIDRQPDEWTIHELAEEIGLPQSTLYNWVQNGRLHSRSVKAGVGAGTKLVTADATTIANLKTIRATPPPWRRLPQPVVDTENPATES